MATDGTAAALVPPDVPLAAVEASAAACTACDLYRDATQTVFWDGPVPAPLLLVGEQPGDAEDRAGAPFVGPAGRELDRLLADAEIPRDATYVTNVVKHFKFEQRGNRRIHAKPNRIEIRACLPWLHEEIRQVDPVVVVALGASAVQAFLGTSARVTRLRGAPQSWEGRAIVPTIHPSAILRRRDDRAAERERTVADLVVARDLAFA